MRDVTACPICETAERTVVSEYSGLVLLRATRQSPLARYEYTLCHGCGLVYASRRPEGDEYRHLVANFDENLGRPPGYSAENPLANAHPLTDEQRAELRGRLERGWLVSEENGDSNGWMPQLLLDRVNHALHLDLIAGSMKLPRGARVLEIRSKTGGLLDALRTTVGAEVYALPAFETLQFVIQELYEIPADGLIDFERFDIPYDGDFDLIIAKHMFTHALYPERFFATVRERLRPGGRLYLYAENSDQKMWERGKNLIGEMKAFHLQNFDLPTFARCLRRSGFEPEWVRHVAKSAMACMARPEPSARFEPISSADLDRRRSMYLRWRDLSILSLPGEVRDLFADELGDVRRRAVAQGDAVGVGPIAIPKRKLRIMHGEGYARLNRGRARAGALFARFR